MVHLGEEQDVVARAEGAELTLDETVVHVLMVLDVVDAVR
jgi:hypothetical protein